MSLNQGQYPEIGKYYWIVYNYMDVGFYKCESKVEGLVDCYKMTKQFYMDHFIQSDGFYEDRISAIEKALERARDHVSCLEMEMAEAVLQQEARP